MGVISLSCESGYFTAAGVLACRGTAGFSTGISREASSGNRIHDGFIFNSFVERHSSGAAERRPLQSDVSWLIPDHRVSYFFSNG
jgi:hypothetical protein